MLAPYLASGLCCLAAQHSIAVVLSSLGIICLYFVWMSFGVVMVYSIQYLPSVTHPMSCFIGLFKIPVDAGV